MHLTNLKFDVQNINWHKQVALHLIVFVSSLHQTGSNNWNMFSYLKDMPCNWFVLPILNIFYTELAANSWQTFIILNLKTEATQWMVAPSNQRSNADFFWWTGALLLHVDVAFCPLIKHIFHRDL